MAKIVGIRSVRFKGQDGEQVAGVNIYVTVPIDEDKGEGCSTERYFVTDSRRANWTYVPRVGDEVRIIYNRYGKCDEMTAVE